MKKVFLVLCVLFFAGSLFAQDIDIYQKRKNTNYKLPYLNPQMTLNEFQLLNRTLRLQDMLYAMIVPGYVHFKAKDPAVGWSLVGLRMAGFGGLGYIYLKNDYSLKELFSGKGEGLPDASEFKTQKKIAYYSIGVIFATYFFDWIHGKYRLDKKQEYIRYKYGLKLNIEAGELKTPAVKGTYPAVGIQYHF